MVDILAVMYTWDRYEILGECLSSLFTNPGMDFRLWVVENGSINSNMYGEDSGLKQLELLIGYYKYGLIDTLILNKKNMGVHYSVNQLMSLAKLTIDIKPKLTQPEFVFQFNDDLIFEPNWLNETYNALIECEDYPKGKVIISSPYHCIWHGIEIPTIDVYKGYMIKNDICGNTWFMRGDIWLNFFGFYNPQSFSNGGDVDKLDMMKTKGWHGAMTKIELAHHNPKAIGMGKYHRSGNW